MKSAFLSIVEEKGDKNIAELALGTNLQNSFAVPEKTDSFT